MQEFLYKRLIFEQLSPVCLHSIQLSPDACQASLGCQAFLPVHYDDCDDHAHIGLLSGEWYELLTGADGRLPGVRGSKTSLRGIGIGIRDLGDYWVLGVRRIGRLVLGSTGSILG